MNFSGQSDSAQRFSVESNLIYMVWKSNAAYGECDATFEVRTSLVGDGADVKIKGKTESGKSLGKLDAKIYGNRLIAGFPIPKNVPFDDLAYLEVKLPKHSLQGETNRIPTRPPIEVQQMKWSTLTAQRGDVLTLTVDFISQVPNDTDAMIAIYEFDHNGDDHDPVVRIPTTVQNKKIQVQWEYEYYDDTGEIPTQPDLQPVGKKYNYPEYFFVVILDEIRIGVNQESGLMKFKDDVTLILTDATGAVISDQEFTIQHPDGEKTNGKLAGDSETTVANLPPGPGSISFKNLGPEEPDTPYEPIPDQDTNTTE
jgi:hypothetical protein